MSRSLRDILYKFPRRSLGIADVLLYFSFILHFCIAGQLATDFLHRSRCLVFPAFMLQLFALVMQRGMSLVHKNGEKKCLSKRELHLRTRSLIISYQKALPLQRNNRF